MKIIEERLSEVMAMQLSAGSHEAIDRGICIQEAVSYVAGEKWSDHPRCACPVISSFLRVWNDRLSDDLRQDLKQYIPLLVGSRASVDVEQKRSWIMTDWVVRQCAPIWLRRAGMGAQADILTSMAPITSAEGYRSVRPAIEAIRAETWPKREASRERLREAFKSKFAELKAAEAAVAVAAVEAAAEAVVAVVAVAVVAAVVAEAAVEAVVEAVVAAVVVVAAEAEAVEAVVAVAAVEAAGHWPTYWKYRSTIREAVSKVIRSKLKAEHDASYASAHAMVRRMLEVSGHNRDVAAAQIILHRAEVSPGLHNVGAVGP